MTRENGRIYLIKCTRMVRADRVIIRDGFHLVRMLESYMSEHGELELVFLEN